jgi:hypothetical protein
LRRKSPKKSEEYGGLNDLILNTTLTNDDESTESPLLSSLANKYNLNVEKDATNNKLSSSIDNLLNSFFSSSDSTKMTTTTTSNNKEFDLNDLIDSELTSANSNTNAFLTRTKSISICFDTSNASAPNNNTIKCSQHSESLKDLANEYLASTNSSSTTALNESNILNNNKDISLLSSSLVEMIDHEFSQRFNINAETNEQPIDLNNLLLNNQNRLKRKSSLSMSINNCSSMGSSNSSLTNLAQHQHHVNKEPLKLLTSIKQDKRHVNECLRNIFALKEMSTFGKFLTRTANKNYLESENVLTFNYRTQSDANNKSQMVRATKRKRIVIDYDLEVFKRREKAKATAANTIKTNSSSKKQKVKESENCDDLDAATVTTIKKIKKQEKANVVSVIKPIKAFDFSIPSPDDVVIAKQKFAFKNIRFK